MKTVIESGIYCSQGDGSSWVNIVNNLITFGNFDVREYLDELLDFERIPDDFLPLFLHEITHHWCFHSPVGSALAYLQLRARRRALTLADRANIFEAHEYLKERIQEKGLILSDKNSEDPHVKMYYDLFQSQPNTPRQNQILSQVAEEKDPELALLATLAKALTSTTDSEVDKRGIEKAILEDVLRYETATQLLRPFAEGLALFAEFDIVSRKSKIRSQVLNQMLIMFSLRESFFNFKGAMISSSIFVDNVLAEKLFKYRTSELGIRRKENFFGKPLTLSDGGYLLGYLTIKRLWKIAISKCSRLVNESDLFLAFIRSFFYDDLGLVALLLDPNIKEPDSVNKIVNHIQQRFYEFDDIDDLERYINKFEDIVDGSIPTNATEWMELQTDANKAKRGRELLENITLDESKSAQNFPDFQLLFYFNARTLAQRQLAFIGSLEALIDIKPDGKVILLDDGKLIFETRTTEKCVSGSGDGSLDLFFSPKDGCRVVVISRGSEIVSIMTYGKENNLPELKDYITSLRMIKYQDDLGKKAILKIYDRWIKYHVNDLKKHLDKILENMYVDIALSRVPDSKFEHCRKMWQEKGLYGILDEDLTLVRALALIGNHCSIIPHKNIIEQTMNSFGFDLEKTLSSFADAAERFGVPEVVTIDDEDKLLFSHL